MNEDFFSLCEMSDTRWQRKCRISHFARARYYGCEGSFNDRPFDPCERVLTFPVGPLRLEAKYREAIFEGDSRPFVCYQIRVGLFVFLDITAMFFQPLFVKIPLVRKGVFFSLHSFSSVSVKMCLFYFHSINSGLNFDRMFLVFCSLKLTV